MVAIAIRGFSGRIPRLDDRLLPDNASAAAINTDYFSGALRGLPALTDAALAHTFSSGTAYARVARVRANDGTDFYVPNTVEVSSVVPNPLVDEAFDRFYIFAENTPPKVISAATLAANGSPSGLALPLPTVAPTLVAAGGTPAGDVASEDRVYCYTWQTTWGEETEPSPTASVLLEAGDEVTVSGIEQPPAISGRSWDKINIYRSAAGTNSVEFYFVAEIEIGETSLVDVLRANLLTYNRVCDAFTNEAPQDGITGVRTHPSGALVGFKGRRVWFSKPYLPHAWPEATSIGVDDEIVGVEVFGNSIAVLTLSTPYQIFGTKPGAFGLRRFTQAVPCVSHRSIVAADTGVYFTSSRGLCFLNESGPTIVTEQTIDEEDWATEFATGDIMAAMYGRQYLGYRRDGTGFVVDPRSGGTTLADWHALGVDTIDPDPYDGTILVTRDTKVYRWAVATQPTGAYLWKSKEFRTGRPLCFGALYIAGARDAGTAYALPVDGSPSVGSLINPTVLEPSRAPYARVRVWADGILRFDQEVDFHEMRRLPSGFKAEAWQVEVSSAFEIHVISMAETGKELMAV